MIRRRAMPRGVRVAALVLPVLLAGAARAEITSRIVATIDGEPVTAHELRRYAKEHAAPGTPDAQVLEALITDKLLEKEIKAQGITAREDEIDRYIEEIRQRNGMDRERFQAALVAQGLSLETYRARVKSELEKAALVNREIRQHVNVSPEEIRRYYDAHLGDYATAERIQVRDIFLAIEDPADETSAAHARAKALEVRAHLGGARAGQGARGAGARPRWARLRGARGAVLGGSGGPQGRRARHLRPRRDGARPRECCLRARAGQGERARARRRRLPSPARRPAHRRGPQAPRRGAGRDPRRAPQPGARGALPELALARPARAPPRGGSRLNPAIFREYDIRGVAEKDFDADFARRLGQTFGTLAAETGRRVVSVGRDCRLTSDAYAAAVAAGIASAGVSVLDIGVCPTPLMYFSLFHWDLDGGIQVTGSHNPADYNGFKLCLGKEALHGGQIQDLRRRLEAGKFKTGRGAIERRPVVPVYQEDIARRVGRLAREIEVVVDAGNGTAGPGGPGIYRPPRARGGGPFCGPGRPFPHPHPPPTRAPHQP